MLLRGTMHFLKESEPDLGLTPSFDVKQNCNILPQIPAEIKKCWYVICLPLFHVLCISQADKEEKQYFLEGHTYCIASLDSSAITCKS